MIELEMDDSTGLPKVPHRYFWRVCDHLGGMPEVELRVKWWFGLGSSMVRWQWLPTMFTERDVQRVAVYLFYEQWTPRSELYGDYPPKRRDTANGDRLISRHTD